MRRTQTLALVVLIALVAGVAGWAVGQRIKNPNEVAALVAAPTASVITAPDESRLLSRDVVGRVSASYSDTTHISVNPASGLNVVTGQVVVPGDLLSQGDVLIEIAERPVIVLQGDIPTFGAIRYGAEGIVVQQLQEALVALGLMDLPADGRFGLRRCSPAYRNPFSRPRILLRCCNIENHFARFSA